jgi:hypothetical protein
MDYVQAVFHPGPSYTVLHLLFFAGIIYTVFCRVYKDGKAQMIKWGLGPKTQQQKAAEEAAFLANVVRYLKQNPALEEQLRASAVTPPGSRGRASDSQ